MDRRLYGGDQSYFARGAHGSSYNQRNHYPDEDLVARSREWISRPDRDRVGGGDPWNRCVDDFLGYRSGGRNDGARGGRDRSRSREREWPGGEGRKGRDRSRERWGSPRDDSDDRDRRYREQRRYSRENSEEKRSSGEEENSNSFKSDPDYDFDRICVGYTADDSLRPEDRCTYQRQAPQKTIVVRGMAQHINEADIQEDITACGLTCRDIRLVRRKDTGTSRGFAFVEFHSVEDASKWIEQKQGELMFKEQFRALMQYTVHKDQQIFGRGKADWVCRCQATNFRRRETCYMCSTSRREGEVHEDTMEISTHPTNTVLLRGLDTLTTEENVLHSIKSLSSLPIRSVRVGRDAATGVSRGVCYLEMNNVVDAMYLHNTLQSSNLTVDDKQPKISYAKLDPVSLHSSAAISGQIANAAVAAAQWSHQTTSSDKQTFKASDVPRLAEYSASLYATNPQEKAAYKAYYEDYYRKQVAEGSSISKPADTASGLATAQAGMNAYQKTQTQPRVPLTAPPDGSGKITYQPPDPSTFQYDKSSGYYYDPYTTLYYDATSQYYFNNKINKFLYWDSSKNTFLISPSDDGKNGESSAKNTNETVAVKEEEEKPKEKEVEKDKVKVAKRIARDMERWAKTLNQKKEIAKQNIVAAQEAAMNSIKGGAADIGYAVLERKDVILPQSSSNCLEKLKMPESLVAAYGQGSDSEEEEEESQEDKHHTDWTKNICLLCKRQFANRDTLVKHQQMSDLHKQNLSAWYKSKGLDPDDAQNRSKQYRDRAKERRLKYGEPDKPQPSRLKESYLKAREAAINYEEPTKSGIGNDNLGNKLLQKMGWQEGQGLGKANQGRTSIITTERRSATAGLGIKSAGVIPGPGETYKDCVKKMMAIRYSELDETS
ncbi:RNA-Hypothetical protein protein [Nesidiocoris tenuis]|uniref:RNA-binding protein 5 n=1 Tax=Nesidiocoris tenuis TaxID=355587 RepID=A0ABN7ALY6_9HEMI|nr:RNA-Hypothetical protein protein [Nesidiocoris tenuis]